eukprot:CAMPEP_0179135958 /NCGR_PEP_ID=MMETSP0796-20121207/64759_1 /TAXON_ID=73915 /ORGANISM="Pyrodinium bahamense, Strain pbaha01" /LENGTH=221 /DNA_ID=CAMNT_0020835007 /DNA_START=625 /DNA_END=1290 /DNA_ORIENTATION=+
MAERAEAGAMLLWDISLEDYKLQCWEPAVRIATCALVACVESMKVMRSHVPEEDCRHAIDVLRVAGCPMGTCSRSLPSAGVRSCAKALISRVKTLLGEQRDCPVDLDWSPRHRRWQSKEKKFLLDTIFFWDSAHEPPHTGLRANLQSFKNPYVGTPLSGRGSSLREREANVWESWSSDYGFAKELRWRLVELNLRPIWRYLGLRSQFCKVRKQTQRDLRQI